MYQNMNEGKQSTDKSSPQNQNYTPILIKKHNPQIEPPRRRQVVYT